MKQESFLRCPGYCCTYDSYNILLLSMDATMSRCCHFNSIQRFVPNVTRENRASEVSRNFDTLLGQVTYKFSKNQIIVFLNQTYNEFTPYRRLLNEKVMILAQY